MSLGLPKYIATGDLEQACVELASDHYGTNPIAGPPIGIKMYRDLLVKVSRIAERRCRESGHVGDCPRVIDFTLPEDRQTGPGLEKWDV